MARRLSFFYGWVIVGISFVSMTLIYGIRHSFSVFFPPILDEFGWSRGSTAVMMSLNILIYGLVSPVAGSLGTHWKPRKVMLTGIALLALTCAGCALAHQLWHFYLLFGILAPLGTALSGWPLLAPALVNWFAKRRGLVIGLGQAGGGLSFVYAMPAAFIISQLGWRHAYFVLAGILVAVQLPLYLLLFFYCPEDKGLRAYGAAEVPATKDFAVEVIAADDSVSPDYTLVHAMRSFRLWLLVLTHFFFWGIGVYLVSAHQVKFAEDIGYSSIFATSVFALFGVSMVIGQFSGYISDRIGREMTVTLATILAIGGLVALMSVRDTSGSWLLYVYAICFGYGAGLYLPGIFAAVADIFPGRHYGAIMGMLIAGMGIGGAIGPWLGGYVYDVSGSYNVAFVLCIVCLVLASITFWLAAPRHVVRMRTKT